MAKIDKAWWRNDASYPTRSLRRYKNDQTMHTVVERDDQGRRWLLDVQSKNRVLLPAGHSLKFKKLNRYRVMLMALNALEK